jgi:hypothetical protein
MKSKALIGLITLSLLAVPATAQNSTNNQSLERGPGLIGAGSPLYSLETAWDNAAVSIGLKKAGNVAQERAAEAKAAQENGNSRAVERATRSLENIAKKAGKNDEEGLNRAMQTMEEVIANAPNEDAREGMQKALENMRNAQDKREEARAQDRRPGNTSDMRSENRTGNGDRVERQNRSGDNQTDSVNSTNSTVDQQAPDTQNRSTGGPR